MSETVSISKNKRLEVLRYDHLDFASPEDMRPNIKSG
jgi:hypothetical protein